MSTNSESFGGTGRVAAAGLMAAWLSACAVAWDGSNAAGGPFDATASAVATKVSKAFRLTPECTARARDLAGASMRAKAARLRPTARMLRGREGEALGRWASSGCPASALVGIAFGAAEAVREQEAGRAAAREGRP